MSLGDQVLSGASNFLTVALVARSTSPHGFGQFALAYAVLLVLVTLVRGVWGTPIALAGSPLGSINEARRYLSAAMVAAPIMLLLVAGPTLLLTQADHWPVTVVVAVAAPIVCGQDLCRFAAVSADRPAVAVVSDSIWLVAVTLGYIFRPNPYSALGIWAAGASLGLVFAMVSLRLWPSIRLGIPALRSWHSTGVGVAALTVCVQVSSYLILVLATVAVGASSAAALRGASSVMAPVNTLLSFLALGLLPAVHRVDLNRQLGMVARIALGILVLTALWCSVLLLTPPSIGQLLLGDTWPLARHILPWTSLEYLFVAVANTAILGLQARQAGRLLVNVGVGAAALMISTSVVAAFRASSATPFAIAQVVAIGIGTVAIWTIYVRMARRPPPRDGVRQEVVPAGPPHSSHEE
jgi:O-antigen/teichoic acid export membrane protein